jgi:hypothetical protein
MRYLLTAGAMVLSAAMIIGAVPAWAEGEKPPPATTANPAVPLNEFELLLRPLTRDDLKVEAEGWVGLLKEHATRVSRNKIDAMRAEGDAKTQILAEATRLQEQQTALMDRVQAVADELRKKGGEVDVYEKYLKTLSGVKVDVSDAGGSWTLLTGWLKSQEGGLRWAKNMLMFILTLIAFKILSLQGTLSNFAAGLMILLYRPYDIGDFVNVAGTSGTVAAMSLVSTTLRSDHQVITIPNGSIWGGTITNGTAQKPAGSA